MIISRRYVPFCILNDRDSHSKLVIEKAYSEASMTNAEIEEHWNLMCCHRISVDNADMGCCIPNFGYIKEEFERLDKEFPYDNGFTLVDANKIYMVDWTNNSLQIQLCNCFDGEEQVIGFAVLSKDNLLPTKIDLGE